MAQQKTNPFTFIVILGLMFLIAFGLYKGCQSCTSSTEKDMLVLVSIQSDGIKLYPKDNYSNVNIKLNDDYKAKVNSITKFTELTIPYDDFVKSSGQRFSILSHKPKSVYISGYKDKEKYWGYFKQND
jgi:hypothetical protein